MHQRGMALRKGACAQWLWVGLDYGLRRTGVAPGPLWAVDMVGLEYGIRSIGTAPGKGGCKAVGRDGDT